MAGQYDFSVERNTHFSFSVVWKDSTGAIVNLTGYTAELQIRSSATSSTVVQSLTTANGKLVITGAQGKVTISMTPAETQALTLRRYVYDLRVVSGTGTATRLIEGSIQVSPEVTR